MKLLRYLLYFFLTAKGLAAHADALPDTVTMTLIKIDAPMKYANAYWMSRDRTIRRVPDGSGRVAGIDGRLGNICDLKVDFNSDSTITYSFPDFDRHITVPIDSMRLYRRRQRGEADGEVPIWYIGQYRRGEIEYCVKALPDGNVSFSADSLKFMNDFLIDVFVENIYTAETDTPDGTFCLTVYRPDKSLEPYFPFPTIVPDGRYEDFSVYRPTVISGVVTKKERGIGDFVRLGENAFYRIDSITPDFGKLVLARVQDSQMRMRLSDEALVELKPYLDKASAEGKMLLVDFWARGADHVWRHFRVWPR